MCTSKLVLPVRAVDVILFLRWGWRSARWEFFVLQACSPFDDAVLVGRARDGCNRSFECLVLRYERTAFAAAYRVLGHIDDAHEVVQEAFMRAYRRLGTLEEASRFAAWFMRILTNHALNYRRGRASGPARVPFHQVDGIELFSRRVSQALAPDEALLASEFAQQTEGAIRELPDPHRRALILSSIEQRPQREVARELGCSVESVKWYVFQARKALRLRLAELVAG